MHSEIPIRFHFNEFDEFKKKRKCTKYIYIYIEREIKWRATSTAFSF